MDQEQQPRALSNDDGSSDSSTDIDAAVDEYLQKVEVVGFAIETINSYHRHCALNWRSFHSSLSLANWTGGESASNPIARNVSAFHDIDQLLLQWHIVVCNCVYHSFHHSIWCWLHR